MAIMHTAATAAASRRCCCEDAGGGAKGDLLSFFFIFRSRRAHFRRTTEESEINEYSGATCRKRERERVGLLCLADEGERKRVEYNRSGQ